MKRYVKSSIDVNDWSQFLSELDSELDNGIDPLYEPTEVGDALWGLCIAAERTLGVSCLISDDFDIVEIYNKMGDWLAAIDYLEFIDDVIRIASKCKTASEFKTKYRNYLSNLI